jgi:hypothetical protein
MNKAMQFKDRIKNLAAKNHIPARAVLQNFMLERLLERIAVSEYRDAFILKGGMLIASMVGIGSRTTMDMGATLRNQPLSEGTVREAFSKICAVPLEDGVTFTLDHILPIREENEYEGYRVAVMARLEMIRTDPTMHQYWSRYSRENEYARGIEFNAVIGAMIDILHL